MAKRKELTEAEILASLEAACTPEAIAASLAADQREWQKTCAEIEEAIKGWKPERRKRRRKRRARA